MTRTIGWFSCGATSAVAIKMALAKGPMTIAYCDTGGEHPDNVRFMADCAKWYGQEIIVLKSDRFDSIWDVFEKTRYLVGIKGARCTGEMKRMPRKAFASPEDIQVFGFDAGEQKRAERFVANNPDVIPSFPLLDAGLTKQDCLDHIQAAGIELPAMYRLGYRNNNCIGCVKGGAGYWNKIRRDFPDVFARMAKLERDIGAAICKTYAGGPRQKVFLDELPLDAGRYEDLEIKCGFLCETEDVLPLQSGDTTLEPTPGPASLDDSEFSARSEF